MEVVSSYLWSPPLGHACAVCSIEGTAFRMKNPQELLDVAAIIVHPQQTSEACRIPAQTQHRRDCPTAWKGQQGVSDIEHCTADI